MPKTTRNSGKPWSAADVKQLRAEVRQNTPTRVLGVHLGRTPGAVAQKASQLGVSLKPTNRSSRGTRKR